MHPFTAAAAAAPTATASATATITATYHFRYRYSAERHPHVAVDADDNLVLSMDNSSNLSRTWNNFARSWKSAAVGPAPGHVGVTQQVSNLPASLEIKSWNNCASSWMSTWTKEKLLRIFRESSFSLLMSGSSRSCRKLQGACSLSMR